MDRSQCTAIEERSTRKLSSEGSDDGDSGKTLYPVISKTVFFEDGSPEVFSNLVAGLSQEL